MDKNIRDIRQVELANIWLKSNRKGIIYAAPRMGKCFIAINILEKLNPHSTILVSYPDNKIRHSWEEDFEKRGYDNPNITFTTHLSLKKYIDKIFDIIIIDEVHLLSENQIEICKELFKENSVILGLTGTLSSATRNTLYNELKLPVLATYSIEQAIQEGVITDYEITVVKVPLDNTKMINYNGKFKTEKKRFDNFTWLIDKLEKEEKNTFFMRLNRMRVIQNSIAKLAKTKQLLQEFKEERILCFCGTIKIADSLGIPSFHSKTKDKNIFQEFADGIGSKLAICKIGNTGVLYQPLNRVIINYTDSNSENLSQKILRCMNFEYNNPDKKAHIILITSSEPTELLWIKKALSMFNKEKIKYL